MAALTSSFISSADKLVTKSEKCVTSSARPTLKVRAASKITGTKVLRKLQVVAVGDKTGTVRSKVTAEEQEVKLLSRIQDLRLLSKAEQAGLLSLAESFGFSLSSIEKLGLLSKAEELGILSALSDPKTPGALLTLSLALLLAGPAAVYFIPEDNTAELVVQIIIAVATVVGGAAAYGGSQLVASLQKS